MGLFTGRKKQERSEAWDSLMKILDLIKVEISGMKKDIEMLQAKFRSKVFKEVEVEEELEEIIEKKDPPGIDDGFDRLRDLAKR